MTDRQFAGLWGAAGLAVCAGIVWAALRAPLYTVDAGGASVHLAVWDVHRTAAAAFRIELVGLGVAAAGALLAIVGGTAGKAVSIALVALPLVGAGIADAVGSAIVGVHWLFLDVPDPVAALDGTKSWGFWVQALATDLLSPVVFVVGILAASTGFVESGPAPVRAARPPAAPRPAATRPREASGERTPEPAEAVATKVCPDCAEPVRAAARKCRYCGYRFEPAEE